jgi:signal transduction histidine kinase
VPDHGSAASRWLQRSVLCAALAAMLWAMTAVPGAVGAHGTELATAVTLAVASVSWLAWTLVGPRGDSPLLQVLVACTAVSGSVLLLLYPALTIYWFAFWACVGAGMNFSQRVGAAIIGASVTILVVGAIAQHGGILGAFAAAAFVGYILGRNRKQYIGQATAATLAAAERERAATLAERGRIARELHDVLGHSLTGVSLQIESAAAALETTADPKRALSHLDRAGSLVRAGQQEAVNAVRTLREGDAEIDVMISGLIATHADAGRAASYAVTGTARPLAAAPALALYRVTQEALTNAAKHAQGQPVEVRLSYADAAVAVCVLNDMPGAAAGATAVAGQTASGENDPAGSEIGTSQNSASQGSASPISGRQGLVGMSERMAAVGGTFAAGCAGSRWRVEAKVTA